MKHLLTVLMMVPILALADPPVMPTEPAENEPSQQNETKSGSGHESHGGVAVVKKDGSKADFLDLLPTVDDPNKKLVEYEDDIVADYTIEDFAVIPMLTS